jgi:two-component system, NarL family, invasion response regulator UvrY
LGLAKHSPGMKILLVDDHAVVRAGVLQLLATEFNASVLEAGSSQATIDICRRERPDLIILELILSGSSGIELIRRLIQLDPSTKILVLSMHTEPIYAARALRTGARGYVSKSASAGELVDAIWKVSKGERYIERDIAAQLALGRFSQKDPLDQLTARETDILRLLGEGKRRSQIAAILGVSYKTIANSSCVIRDKLAVETIGDLIRLSIENQRK